MLITVGFFICLSVLETPTFNELAAVSATLCPTGIAKNYHSPEQTTQVKLKDELRSISQAKPAEQLAGQRAVFKLHEFCRFGRDQVVL